MSRWYQALIIVQIVFICIFSLNFSPFASAEEMHEVKSCLQCEMKIKSELKVHLDFYNEMLVHRYAPTKVDYWRSVRSERDLLHKKIKASGKFPYLKERD